MPSTPSPRWPAARSTTSSRTGRCTTRRIDNAAHAEAVVAAAREYDPSLAILGQPDSELLAAAERAGLEAVAEGFVDRAYRPDGRLVPRSEEGAVITDVDAAVGQAVRIAVDGEVVAVDGEVISLHARSLCVHGDTPGAVDLATAARQALEAAGVGVFAFCG